MPPERRPMRRPELPERHPRRRDEPDPSHRRVQHPLIVAVVGFLALGIIRRPWTAETELHGYPFRLHARGPRAIISGFFKWQTIA